MGPPDPNFKAPFGDLTPASLPAVQGTALAARLNIEAQILNRPRRLPGLLVPGMSLTEDMETITPADYLGIDQENGTAQDPLAQRKES